MNTQLLNRVTFAILNEPRKFDISSWVEHDRRSPCGTTACIAGHALAINRKFKSLKPLFPLDELDAIEESAKNALGLTNDEARRLFYRPIWPNGFHPIAYREDGESIEEVADNAFWRIQHFIATNGAE